MTLKTLQARESVLLVVRQMKSLKSWMFFYLFLSVTLAILFRLGLVLVLLCDLAILLSLVVKYFRPEAVKLTWIEILFIGIPVLVLNAAYWSPTPLGYRELP